MIGVAGDLQIRTAVEAIKSGARTVLRKPIGIAEILRRYETDDLEPDLDQERRWTLAENRHVYAMRIVADSNGDLDRAAEILDVDRRTVVRLQKKPIRRALRRVFVRTEVTRR